MRSKRGASSASSRLTSSVNPFSMNRAGPKKVLVSLGVEKPPYGYKCLRGKATELVPALAAQWLAEDNDRPN